MPRFVRNTIACAMPLLLAAAAQALTISTATPLSGAAENPANASPAAGNAFAVLDTTTHQLRVYAVFAGLTAGTTAAHIHCCTTAPGNAGVATTLPAFVGFPLGVTSGSMDQTYDMTQAGTWNPAFVANNGGTVAGAEAALAAGLAAGQAYFNVHTSAFPGGEIRGFLVPQALPTAATIPTLSQWGTATLLALVAAAGWTVLRRRGVRVRR